MFNLKTTTNIFDFIVFIWKQTFVMLIVEFVCEIVKKCLYPFEAFHVQTSQKLFIFNNLKNKLWYQGFFLIIYALKHRIIYNNHRNINNIYNGIIVLIIIDI